MNKLKVQNQLLWVAVIVIGVVGVAVGALAYSGSAQNVTESGDINVYNYASPAPVSQEKKLGSDDSGEIFGAAVASDATYLASEPKPTAFGATYFSDDLEIYDNVARRGASTTEFALVDKYDVQAWPTDTYFTAFQNPFGSTATSSVDYVAIQILGTVSSTINWSCGVTSTKSIIYNTTVEPDQLIDDFQIVTTTQMMDNNVTSTISNIDTTDNGTNGRPIVTVPPNWYAFCMVQAMSGAGGNSSTVETVTSTGRGWTAKIWTHWLRAE